MAVPLPPPYPDKVMTFYFLASLFRLKKSSFFGEAFFFFLGGGGGGGQLKMLVPPMKTQSP